MQYFGLILKMDSIVDCCGTRGSGSEKAYISAIVSVTLHYRRYCYRRLGRLGSRARWALRLRSYAFL